MEEQKTPEQETRMEDELINIEQMLELEAEKREKRSSQILTEKILKKRNDFLLLLQVVCIIIDKE